MSADVDAVNVSQRSRLWVAQECCNLSLFIHIFLMPSLSVNKNTFSFFLPANVVDFNSIILDQTSEEYHRGSVIGLMKKGSVLVCGILALVFVLDLFYIACLYIFMHQSSFWINNYVNYVYICYKIFIQTVFTTIIIKSFFAVTRINQNLCCILLIPVLFNVFIGGFLLLFFEYLYFYDNNSNNILTNSNFTLKLDCDFFDCGYFVLYFVFQFVGYCVLFPLFSILVYFQCLIKTTNKSENSNDFGKKLKTDSVRKDNAPSVLTKTSQSPTEPLVIKLKNSYVPRMYEMGQKGARFTKLKRVHHYNARKKNSMASTNISAYSEMSVFSDFSSIAGMTNTTNASTDDGTTNSNRHLLKMVHSGGVLLSQQNQNQFQTNSNEVSTIYDGTNNQLAAKMQLTNNNENNNHNHESLAIVNRISINLSKKEFLCHFVLFSIFLVILIIFMFAVNAIEWNEITNYYFVVYLYIVMSLVLCIVKLGLKHIASNLDEWRMRYYEETRHFLNVLRTYGTNDNNRPNTELMVANNREKITSLQLQTPISMEILMEYLLAVVYWLLYHELIVSYINDVANSNDVDWAPIVWIVILHVISEMFHSVLLNSETWFDISQWYVLIE